MIHKHAVRKNSEMDFQHRGRGTKLKIYEEVCSNEQEIRAGHFRFFKTFSLIKNDFLHFLSS